MWRPKRLSKEQLEERRKEAGRRFEEGEETQEEIAVVLGVNRYTVTKWHKRWKAEGEAGLAAVHHQGAVPKLDSEKLAEVLEKLKGGAKAFGYEGDNWTAKRVAEVIQRETKVGYHPEHVRRLLRAKGWTPQKAVGKPQERDEAVVRDWVDKTVPELVKKNRRGPQ
jgi:putative transposase